MAEPTKQVRIFERLAKPLEKLAELMTKEIGLEVNQTEATSKAIEEALERRQQNAGNRRK